MMRTLFAAALAAAVLLSGCGLKGDLYLPESKPPAKKPHKPSAPAPEAGSPS